MQGCSYVVGLVPSCPYVQSRWLAWVHCVVPRVPGGGLLRVGLPCRAGTFEDVGCGVLGQGYGEFVSCSQGHRHGQFGSVPLVLRWEVPGWS